MESLAYMTVATAGSSAANVYVDFCDRKKTVGRQIPLISVCLTTIAMAEKTDYAFYDLLFYHDQEEEWNFAVI